MAILPTTGWDETQPPATQSAGLGDDRIREMKTQVREVVDVDHKFDSSGSDAEMGMHKIIRFLTEAGTPLTDSDHIQFYQREVGGVDELFVKDTAGNEIQITDGGEVADVVFLSGAQTITGVKTFQADPTLEKSNLVATPYNTGNVTATNGSVNIVGSGTLWDTDDNVKAGQAMFMTADDQYYIISSITDDTHLVLTIAYNGTTGAGKAYEIVPTLDGLSAGNHKEVTLLDHPDSSVTTAKIADDAVTTDKVNDDAITGDKIDLGAWVARVRDTSYLAVTAGFVVGWAGGPGAVAGYTDAADPPITRRVQDSTTGGSGMSFMMPVRKGHYWKTTGTTGGTWWVPLGAV